MTASCEHQHQRRQLNSTTIARNTVITASEVSGGPIFSSTPTEVCQVMYKMTVYPCNDEEDVNNKYGSTKCTDLYKGWPNNPIQVNATWNTDKHGLRDPTIQPTTAMVSYPQPSSCTTVRKVIGVLSTTLTSCSSQNSIQSSTFYPDPEPKDGSTPGPFIPYRCMWPLDPATGAYPKEPIVDPTFGLLRFNKGDYRLEQGIYAYYYNFVLSCILMGLPVIFPCLLMSCYVDPLLIRCLCLCCFPVVKPTIEMSVICSSQTTTRKCAYCGADFHGLPCTR